MKFRQNGGVILIALSLIAVVYGDRRTAPQAAPPSARSARRAPLDRTIVVDQSSLITAEQLVHMPTPADERPFAEDALRIADNEMDLAFAQAVRRTLNQPRATTAEATEAGVASAESLSDRLDLVKAKFALDQGEADDARQDLRRAGWRSPTAPPSRDTISIARHRDAGSGTTCGAGLYRTAMDLLAGVKAVAPAHVAAPAV